MKMKISDLLILCAQSAILSQTLMLGGRLSVPSFQSVEDSTRFLFPNLLSLNMFKGSKYDYAIPEFDSVGMQSVPGVALSNQFASVTDVPDDLNGTLNLSTDLFNSLGYAPRYVDYKTSIDVVTGAFTGSLAYWAAPMSDNYFKALINSIKNGKKLTPAFFKCNPSILDTIFAYAADGSIDSDNLLVSCYNDIKAVRNLDYNGLPY